MRANKIIETYNSMANAYTQPDQIFDVDEGDEYALQSMGESNAYEKRVLAKFCSKVEAEGRKLIIFSRQFMTVMWGKRAGCESDTSESVVRFKMERVRPFFLLSSANAGH